MSTEVTTKHLRQVTSVRELLVNKNAQAQLGKVAADQMNPERMMRLMAGALRTTPKLGQCEPMSFLGALMECAALNLQPNTPLGHAWLIPFDRNVKDRDGKWSKITEVQLVIGYRGYIELARRSDRVKGFQVGVHYSDDPHWVYRQGTDPVLEHEPGPQHGERGHAYAIVHYLAGGYDMVCWPWEKVIAHRDRYSKGYQQAVEKAKKYGKDEIDSPWVTNPDAMAIKTLIRQLAKFMPQSANVLQRALQTDGSKLDYRGFAQNPEAGSASMIEGTVLPPDDTPPEVDEPTDDEDPDMVEGEADEQPPAEEKPAKKADPKPAERSKKAPANKSKPEPEKKPAKTKDEDPPADDEGDAQDDPPSDEEEGKGEDAPDPALLSLRDLIVTDLADGGSHSLKAVLQLHAESIERLKKEAPELAKEVEQAIADAEDGKFDSEEE